MKRRLLVAMLLVSFLFSYGVASGSSTGSLYLNAVVRDTTGLRAENGVYENSGLNSASGSGFLPGAFEAFWPMYFNSKLNVKGWGRDSSWAYGWCQTHLNGTFLLYDEVIDRSYTGTYTTDGKTIQFTLDSNGLAELADMLVAWITEMGASGGLVVDVQDLSGYVTISKAKLQKKTSAPKTVKVKVTGTVSALVNGTPKTASFSYQSTIKYY